MNDETCDLLFSILFIVFTNPWENLVPLTDLKQCAIYLLFLANTIA